MSFGRSIDRDGMKVVTTSTGSQPKKIRYNVGFIIWSMLAFPNDPER
jgi:hypothetical protein